MFPGPTATPRCHFNDNSPLMKDHPCSFLPLNAPLSLPLSRKIFQCAAFLCLDVLSDSHVPKQLVSSGRDDDAVLFTVLGLCFLPLFLYLTSTVEQRVQISQHFFQFTSNITPFPKSTLNYKSTKILSETQASPIQNLKNHGLTMKKQEYYML